MPVSGLVLLLRPEEPLAPLMDALEQHPDLMVAEPVDRRVPIVTDTRDAQHDKDVWGWLRARPEVLEVAVALIHDDSRNA